MVQFNYTLDGYEVLVDNQLLGYITKERGFSTSPFTIKVPLIVSSSDLILIAKKVEEVKGEDHAPDHICRSCGGTPNFPKQLCYSETATIQCCRHPIHQYRVK